VKSYENLWHIKEYIRQQSLIPLEDFELQFLKTMKRISRFKTLNERTKILEVGTGIGWFPILCKKNGIFCEGLEISPQLVEYGKTLGRKYLIEPNIEIGNIEESDIGTSKYDVVLALSTFEHVEHWQRGLRKIYDALKPGGLFYFYSTNRFSVRSGEFKMPFYGWLPDRWRYRIRVAWSGEEIMKLGIDFNQFNHIQLKRFFLELGYQKVVDQFGIIEISDIVYPKRWKVVALKLFHHVKPLRWLGLVFAGGTLFICIKKGGESKSESMQTA
jgi:2-polyprenyl-3-methyl-5-hydroxy-6-metoxy-1,4-benzoquinol methylase